MMDAIREGVGRNVMAAGRAAPAMVLPPMVLPPLSSGQTLLLGPEVLARYCRAASEADKRQLYDVLGSRNEQKIQEMIDRVTKMILDAGPDKTGAVNGSQPIRSETNRTSSAAGSRR